MGESQKVNAENCIVIKPSISTNPPEGMTNFYYEKQLLLDIGVQLKLSASASDSSGSMSGRKTKTVQKLKCKLCNKLIAADKLIGHVGFHILSKHVEGEVCGFCGFITCSNKLKQTSKNKDKTYYKIDSKCNYVFPYKRQPTYSRRERCTIWQNVPNDFF